MYLSSCKSFFICFVFCWIDHAHFPQGCGWFLTCRTIQTSLPVSKGLNCDLISRCEYPSRNPTSPLDCRAGDHFISSPPPPPPPHRPARTICYIYSPLRSLFYAGGRPRHSDTSAHNGRRESEARQVGRQAGGRADGRTAAAAGTGATCQSLLETGGLDGGFLYPTDLDRVLG